MFFSKDSYERPEFGLCLGTLDLDEEQITF